MSKLAALAEERNKCVADARAINDKADAEKRKLTAEEQQQWDKLFARHDEIVAMEEREKRLEDAETRAIASRGRAKLEPAPLGAEPKPKGDKNPETRSIKVHKQEFRCTPGTPLYERSFGEYRTHFDNWLATGDETIKHKPECRSLQTDLDTKGGFLTVPEQFVAELIKDLDDTVFMRGLCRNFAIRVQKLGAPRRTAKASTWQKGGELSTPSADSTLAFGKRALEPHHFSGEISISNDLLGSSVMDMEQIVIDELNMDRRELEESLFMTGTGAQEPLGAFTASSDGISTSRDVSTGNTTTTIGADGLIEALYSLKSAYQDRATWLFSRTAVKQIRKLKDGDGQYLWQPGLQGGQPALILGRPFVMSEWVPATFTTGLYVGLVGDFNWYWIVDGLEIGLIRDGNSVTAARANVVYFVARVKFDGAPVKEEAFARVKLA